MRGVIHGGWVIRRNWFCNLRPLCSTTR
jgi:hypothetical protein